MPLSFLLPVVLLLALFLSLLALVKERKNSQATLAQYQEMRKQQQLLHPYALELLVQGHAPSFDMLEAFHSVFGLNFESENFMLLVIKLRHATTALNDSDSAQLKHAYDAVRDELNGMLGMTTKLYFLEVDGLLVCFYSEPRVTLLPPSANQKSLRDLLAQQCTACAAILMESGIDVIIAIGQYDVGGFGLHTNFISTKALLEQAMCSKWTDNVIAEATALTQRMDPELSTTQRQFYNCFICFQYQAAAEYLFHMVELRIRNYFDTFEDAREIVAKQLHFCVNMLELPLNIPLALEDGSEIAIRDLMFSPDLDSLHSRLLQYFSGLERHVAGSSSQAAPTTSRVHDYIEAHYRDPEISVSSISEKFGLNVSYLSRQFKQAYGIGVLEFIHSTRITQAKRLMSEGMPLSKIVEQVGYTSRRAFDSAFSRQEGLTPKAYQDQLLSGR